MKTPSAKTLLKELERLQFSFGPDFQSAKLELLTTLANSRLPAANDVFGLHEILCFMYAYPDSRRLLRQVTAMLDGFAHRPDLSRHSSALADSGIAGTLIHYRFHWKTAKWLGDHWPGSLLVDWAEFEGETALDDLMPLLLPQPAQETLEHLYLSPQEWIDELKRPDETDATYLIRLFARWRAGEAVREKSYDGLDLPLVLRPAPGSPSRTGARIKPRRPSYGPPQGPLPPDGAQSFPAPSDIREVSPRHGRTLINLARTQMVTRSRDLYAFMNADACDVRIVTYAGGIQFISYGLHPHARSLLEAMYVFLILKNGLPVGYTQAATLFRSAEINFNVFDTFRGAETSRIFSLTLSMVRHLFGCDTFVINTQQLGEDNEEAIQTGAFWFYHKHGFRPRNPGLLELASRELERRQRNPRHRSSPGTLRNLAGGPLYLSLGKPREDLVHTIPAAAVGLAAARELERHATATDPSGARQCVAKASRLLGRRIDSRLTAAQREMWERWSPLVLCLPGVQRWSTGNRVRLADLINAKGGHRESDFVALFDGHRALRRALLRLGSSQTGSTR